MWVTLCCKGYTLTLASRQQPKQDFEGCFLFCQGQITCPCWTKRLINCCVLVLMSNDVAPQIYTCNSKVCRKPKRSSVSCCKQWQASHQGTVSCTWNLNAALYTMQVVDWSNMLLGRITSNCRWGVLLFKISPLLHYMLPACLDVLV